MGAYSKKAAHFSLSEVLYWHLPERRITAIIPADFLFGPRMPKKTEISGRRLSFCPFEKRRAPAEAPHTEKQV